MNVVKEKEAGWVCRFIHYLTVLIWLLYIPTFQTNVIFCNRGRK